MKMKMTALNIKAELMKLAKSREIASTEQAEKIVNTMKEELVSLTPIDTGLARRSWSIQRFGSIFNVKNSVPYIERLNAGSSIQAPARFIESTALKYGTPLGTIVERDE
jgi:hypothetical protein